MIEDTVVVFPNNAADIIATRIPAYCDPVPTDLTVFKRPLRSTDPNQCCSVVPSIWTPTPETAEIMGQPNFGHSLNRFIITIQALIKDMDEPRGLARHSVLSAKLRGMLYRDGPLRVGLTALSVVEGGRTETVKQWGVNTQRFLANEYPKGSFIFLSNLELFLETESR